MIITKDLCYVYSEGAGDHKALNSVNLHIKRGDYVGIIGHTGSGKSTLIGHFNALEKPTSGEIIIDGVNIWAQKKPDLRAVRRKVGVVFQYPEHQLMEETVRRDIAFGPLNMGLSKKEVEERVLWAAGELGIPDEYLDASPFELSGGEKRRVAIAGILAMKPEVLVLDEPTAGLDPKGRDELLSLTKRLNDQGITVVLVSHSMEDIAKVAKTVVVLNDGEIAMTGSVSEVFARADELKSMGLNVPEITQVIAKLRENGVCIDKDIYTVEAAAEAVYELIKKKNQEGTDND